MRLAIDADGFYGLRVHAAMLLAMSLYFLLRIERSQQRKERPI